MVREDKPVGWVQNTATLLQVMEHLKGSGVQVLSVSYTAHAFLAGEYNS